MFWNFLHFFFNIDCRKKVHFLVPSVIVFNSIGANFLFFCFFFFLPYALIFLHFSFFLYLWFLAVSRYSCRVVIVCLPIVIFPNFFFPKRTLLFMIIVIYIFFPFCNYYEKKKTSNKIKCRKPYRCFFSFFFFFLGGLGFPVSTGPIMVIVKMNIIDFSASGQWLLFKCELTRLQ